MEGPPTFNPVRRPEGIEGSVVGDVWGSGHWWWQGGPVHREPWEGREEWAEGIGVGSEKRVELVSGWGRGQGLGAFPKKHRGPSLKICSCFW